MWDPGRRRYAWLETAPAALRRRFDLDDYGAAVSGSDVGASVLVQALESVDESEELLAVAATSSVVAGVVGWADLTAPDVAGPVAALRSGPGGHLLVGIRHLVHDEADPGWLSRPEVKRGLRAVADAGLVYDLLVRSRELPSALAAVDAVDGGRFVLDHGAKPEIATGGAQPWSDLVADLARRPNVVCKLSGLVTEAGPAWTLEQIAPYVDHLLDTFGPDRLLFGSDWPVCTVRAGYADVVELARSLLAERLSADERAKVMWANAQETYGLDVRRP